MQQLAYLAEVVLPAIALNTFFVEGLEHLVPSFLPFLLVITLSYWTLGRSSGRRRNGRSEP